MAACVAALTHYKVACVPLLAAHGAAGAWCKGVLGQTVDVRALCNPCRLPASTLALLPGHVSTLALLPGHVSTLPCKSDEVESLMLALFETFSNLLLYKPPVAPDAAIFVYAQHDHFVPPSSTESLHEHWKGSQARALPGGHATT
jgi:hypothetical protein